ncbi:luciferase family protein [Streptomyces sp. NPDC086519]|uniref:luciferase domain-containing protein n=1 Tax=Streptomyces sp. NPDC086519 TaxID=3154863 RepID=UPI0034125D2C
MCSQGCEIVHFQSTSDADLHLTGRMIRRLGDQLRRSTAIRLLAESQWATVHLDDDADTDTLLSLVSAALQGAHGVRRSGTGTQLEPGDLPRPKRWPGFLRPTTARPRSAAAMLTGSSGNDRFFLCLPASEQAASVTRRPDSRANLSLSSSAGARAAGRGG